MDHHAFVFDPTSQGTAYNGNDGGIYRTTDGGATWTPLSRNISALQHYNIALHPTDPDIFFAGRSEHVRPGVWVAEMADYPYGVEGGGRVARLIDTDGDGKLDKRENFLGGLSFPAGVMAWGKGVIVTAAPRESGAMSP